MRAMGAAIEKAVCLALELQRRGYSIGIITGTAEVVDDVIPDDNVSRPCSPPGVGLIVGYGIGQSDETTVDNRTSYSKAVGAIFGFTKLVLCLEMYLQ